MFTYKKVEKKKIESIFDNYVASLSGVYDNYLENYILKSDFYKMTFKRKTIGCFAVHNDELLTQFYIEDDYVHLAQGSFNSVLQALNLKTAYVPTCDEFMLSLCMDFHKDIEMQAYNFLITDRSVDGPKYPKHMLRLANLSDADQIKASSNDFFDDLYQQISDRKIYVFEDDEVYGYGIVEENKIHLEYAGIGMFTLEAHRNKGVGRSIILHLKDLVETLGYKALPGCWYHNYNSKRTLESCGFASKTRLLKIKF